MITERCPCGASVTVGRLGDAPDPVAAGIAADWLAGHTDLHASADVARTAEQRVRAYEDHPNPERPAHGHTPKRRPSMSPLTTTPRCGYTLVDPEGEEYPCDRPADGWRWYQDVEHEDCLDHACDWHANEGGRRMYAVLVICDAIDRTLSESGTKAVIVGPSLKWVADEIRAVMCGAR